jgi:membrane-associated phospholipid phosphatase
MWFADVALALAGFAAALWIGTAVVWVAWPAVLPAGVRGGLAASGLPILLWAAQSQVVDEVADRHGVDPADLAVWSWFVDHRFPAATWVLKAVTTAGSPTGMTALASAVVLVLVLRRRWVEAAAVGVATAGTSVLIGVFKGLYDRARPPLGQQLLTETNPSLPSGHALTSIVVLGIVVAVVLPAVTRTAPRVLLVTAAASAVVAIGVSRLYLGVHWASDVVVGWLLGGAWLAVCVGFLLVARSRTAGAALPVHEATAGA